MIFCKTPASISQKIKNVSPILQSLIFFFLNLLTSLIKYISTIKKINCDYYGQAVSFGKKNPASEVFPRLKTSSRLAFLHAADDFFFSPHSLHMRPCCFETVKSVRHTHTHITLAKKKMHGSPQNHYSCSSCLTEHQTINKRQERHSS